MKRQSNFVLGMLCLVLLTLACRFSAPTPVAWVPTETEIAVLQTQTAIISKQTAYPVVTKVPTPTATATNTPENNLQEDDGPWLIFPNEEGTAFYALEQDTAALILLQMPIILDVYDVLGGIAPDGSQWMVRAGTVAVEDELAVYRVIDPLEPVEKITPLLSLNLQQSVLEEQNFQASMALKAVQYPASFGWSPDSKQVAFPAALHNLSSEIYLYSLENMSLQRLTARYQQDLTPLWNPGMEWVLFQEADTFRPNVDWEPGLVAALGMPDLAVTRFLFNSSPANLGEVFIGWTDALHFLSYARTEQSGNTLRLTHVEAGNPRTLFAGSFKELALDPATNDIALLIDAQTALDNKQSPGVYYSTAASSNFRQILPGEYEKLSFSKAAGLFWAANAAGVVVFGRDGITASFPGTSQVAYANHRNWLIASGGQGAWLYSGDGTRLQQLTGQTVSAAVWREDSQGFYLLLPDGLYQADFPLLQLQLVCNDVYRDGDTPFVWHTP